MGSKLGAGQEEWGAGGEAQEGAALLTLTVMSEHVFFHEEGQDYIHTSYVIRLQPITPK